MQDSPSTGRLLGFLGAIAYILFTLLPDSSSWAVLYPWVLLWQAGLFAFSAVALLLLWRGRSPFYLLGQQLDWAVALLFVAFCISTIFARFPQQGLWYSLIGFSFMAIVYVLNNHLNHNDSVDRLLRLLRFQGVLSLVFVIESLGLWIYTTLLPELQRIDKLRQVGVKLNYDFSVIQLRNWAPLGHQNYTAGILMLALPLFAGLAIAIPKQKWIWLVGIGLGLIDLYTTSSRGGFLGLLLLLIFGVVIAFGRRVIARVNLIWAGLAAFGLVSVAIASNNRLQTLVASLFSGSGGSELAFRGVTIATGWQMGLAHWLTGAGAGGAFMLYQQFRPSWGASISEMIFQLHNTPIQIWAELGIFGVLAVTAGAIATIVLFFRLHFSPTWLAHHQHQVLTYALFGGLLAYSAIAFTDYQLDVLAIAGMLCVIWVSLAHIGQIHLGYRQALWQHAGLRQALAATVTIFAIAACAWLVPVDMAWHLSSIGFSALARNPPQLQVFEQNLARAHELAGWEPYYALQLGWNLAERGRSSGDRALIDRGLVWLEKGITANPYQEFGYNSVAWLNLQKQNAAPKAEANFRRALQLSPNRRNLHFGLGVSLLQQNRIEAGLGEITTEIAKFPTFATSPLWNAPQWQNYYPQILEKLKTRKPAIPPVLNWWTSKTESARKQAIAELRTQGGNAATLADALENKQAKLKPLLGNPETSLTLAIAAWYNPTKRHEYLAHAWAITSQSIPDQNSEIIVNALVERMAKAKNFDAWLREPVAFNSPLLLRSRAARLGFGVNSRRIDGGIPSDFFELQTQAIVYGFLGDLFAA